MEPCNDDFLSRSSGVDKLPIQGTTPPTIDTGFLEYVWRLLIRDTDIRTQEDHQHNGRVLAQADEEATNASTHLSNEGSHAVVQISTASNLNQSEPDSSNQEAVHGPSTATSAPKDVSATPIIRTESGTVDCATESIAPGIAVESQPAELISGRGTRLIASESRIWRTIAGHEADFSRIPGLDFVCLSIIAASGRSGVVQNDLVRITGQDKRSLPLRTDRLHKNGYIIKRPVTIHVDKGLMHTSLLILRRYSETSAAIATELTEAANSVPRTGKGKKKRGISRASALDQGQGLELVDEDGPIQSTPVPDPIICWAPDRNLWNQIFDLVHLSGTAGITLNHLSRNLMGPHYKKPLEEIIAKLTHAWQLSQPMHLRHLAIVRDSVQCGKTSVYVYYTFEYYQMLVGAGQKTWEAVLMLQDIDQRLKNVSTMYTNPELDEHGFANLDPDQFQGEYNNAPLYKCVSASRKDSNKADAESIRASEIHEHPQRISRRSLTPIKFTSTTPAKSRRNETTVVRKGRGRPRKYTLDGIPADIESWGTDEIKNLVESRRMHDKYQKTRITDEIERRTEQRQDSVLVTHEILKITDALRKEQGQDPLSAFMIMQIVHEHAGGPKPAQEDDTMVQLRELLKNSEQKMSPKLGRPRKVESTHSSLLNDKSRPPSDAVGQSWPIAFDPIGTRKRRPPKAFDMSPISANEVGQNSRVRKPIQRPRERDGIPSHWHLPSVAAHSQLLHNIAFPIVAADQTVTQGTSMQKRGHSHATIDVGADSTVVMPRSKRQKKIHHYDDVINIASATPNLGTSSPTPTVPQVSTLGDQLLPHAVHHLMFETYKKAVDSIPRTREGVFVSRSAQRYRRRNEPVSMVSRKYQMAIFKLSALNGLVWFDREQSPVSSALSDQSQRPERNSNRREPTFDVLEFPSPDVLPFTEVESSTENVNALQNQRMASDLEFETLQNDSEGIDEHSGAMLISDHSLSTFGAHRQDLSATSIVNSEHEIVTPLTTQANNAHPTDAPMDSSTSVCDALPSTSPPAHMSHEDLLHNSAPEPATKLVDEMPNTHVDETSGIEISLTDATLRDVDSSPGRDTFKLKKTSDAATRTRRPSLEQRPLHFVFNLRGLKSPDWFQHVPAQSHGQIESDSILEPLPTDHAEGTQTGPPDTVHNKAPTQEDQQSDVNQHAQGSRQVKAVGITGRTGGSTAILRRDIVVNLVERCGGVFPEAGAMRIPFQQEWKQRGQAGVPEKATIMNAVNICCEQGKLRRIVFSFKDTNGISATSTVFALPDIDPGDARVRDLQEMVKQRHPHLFIPAAVAPVDMVTETNRQQKLLEAAEKQAQMDEAKAMALKSPQERESYLATLHASGLSRREIAALSRLVEPSTDKVQRLGTRMKPARARSSFPAAADVQTERIAPSRQLSSIAADHSTNGLPTMGEHLFDQDFDRQRRLRVDQLDGPSVRFERSHQRLQGLARNATHIERDQRQISQAYPYAQDTITSNLSMAPNKYIDPVFIDPNMGQLEGIGTISPLDMRIPTATIMSEFSARSRNKKHPENEAQIFPGFMDPVIMYHRATGTFSATFPGFRSGRTKLNLRGKRRYIPRFQVPVGYKSPFTTSQLDNGFLFPGISSRDILHPSTGTFSVKFFGFRPRHVNAADGKGRKGGRPTKTTANIGILETSRGSKRKRRRTESGAGGSLSGEEDWPSVDLTASPFKLRRLRGPQSMKALGKNGALRLSVAVMVVRILTGGIRMTIDWTLVTKAFTPEHDEKFIRSKWSSVLSQMRHNQVKMDADFQTIFTKAYKESLIPTIDFEHLDEYDWKWLVEWTMIQLDAPINAAPELLVPRSSFDQRYVIKDASQRKDLAHFFEFEGFATRELRRSVVNRQAYVHSPLAKWSPRRASTMQAEDEQVAIARSWIRASIVTPIETSDPLVIRSKLTSFSAATIDATLKSLLDDKVITERSKRQTRSDFDYDISDYFEKRLRTNISPAQFHSAFAFKFQLDWAIQSQGRARWDYLAQDGDVMALMNLMASLKVRMVPINPPLNKWGHTDDGYASRQMDKSKLNFEMEIAPSSTYVMGNPLDPLPPPPTPHLKAADHGMPKIPAWYDINETLIPKMWTPVLAAVLGLLAVRSGATAEELQFHIRPSLEVWEVEEVLQWMVHAKVAETVGSNGFKTKEWWWMALGPSPDLEPVRDGYRLGFASTTEKSNTPKRRYKKAEEQSRKRIASSSRGPTQ